MISPWQEASAGVSHMGDTINQLALRMAQMKFRDQQLQQQLMLRQQALQEQQRHNVAQEKYYGLQGEAATARAEQSRSVAKLNEKKVTTADAFGDAMARQLYSQTPVPGISGDVPLGFENMLPMTHLNKMSREDALADSVKQAAIAAALFGQPERASGFQQENMVNQGLLQDPRLQEIIRLMATGTRSQFPVSGGAAPYNAATGQMGTPVPKQFSPGSLPGGTDVNPNNAFNAIRDPQFNLADPIVQDIAWRALTNSPSGRATMQAQPQVPPPQQPLVLGKYKILGVSTNR